MAGPRVALPMPAPEDLEGVVARSIRNRDFELDLQQFWPLAARRLAENEPTDTVLSSFPETERDYAWTHEYASLASLRVTQDKVNEFRRELLGSDDATDPALLTRLNTWIFRGSELKEKWTWWRRRQAARGALTGARNSALEGRVRAEPSLAGPRRLYADWLEDQPRGSGLGAYIELSLGGPELRWRADLLIELEPNVLGPLAPFSAHLTWDRGFVTRARVEGPALPIALEHPVVFMADELAVRMTRAAINGLGAGPYRVQKLEVTWEHNVEVTAGIEYLLAGASRLPSLKSLTLDSEAVSKKALRALVAAFPQAVVRRVRRPE